MGVKSLSRMFDVLVLMLFAAFIFVVGFDYGIEAQKESEQIGVSTVGVQ